MKRLDWCVGTGLDKIQFDENWRRDHTREKFSTFPLVLTDVNYLNQSYCWFLKGENVRSHVQLIQ